MKAKAAAKPPAPRAMGHWRLPAALSVCSAGGASVVVAEPASASVLDGEDSSVGDSVGDSVVDAAEDSASVGEAV
jgi:hypothetical protein